MRPGRTTGAQVVFFDAAAITAYIAGAIAFLAGLHGGPAGIPVAVIAGLAALAASSAGLACQFG